MDITGNPAAASGRTYEDADISEGHSPKERGLSYFECSITIDELYFLLYLAK